MSRLAWPESVGVLAASRRGRRLTEEHHQAAARALSSCFERCTVVSVADPIVDHAAELAAVGSDSVFVSWDKRLRRAATVAGLVTAPAG